MSKEIFESVPNHDPTQALLDVERFENISSSHTEFSLFRGPFGVSKLPDPKSPSPSSDDEIAFLPEDWELDLDQTIQTSYLADINEELGSLSGLHENHDDTINDTIPPQPRPRMCDDCTESALEVPLEPPLTFFNNDIETWSILSHYKDRIVPLISPLGPGQEAPWLKLIMTCAVHTLGELTMNGKAAHIRLALLNALLSTSSYHLGNSVAVPIQNWRERGDLSLKRAQYHFVKCMEETCISSTKMSKYKEILMTILCLSTVYVSG